MTKRDFKVKDSGLSWKEREELETKREKIKGKQKDLKTF